MVIITAGIVIITAGIAIVTAGIAVVTAGIAVVTAAINLPYRDGGFIFPIDKLNGSGEVGVVVAWIIIEGMIKQVIVVEGKG